MKITDKAVEAFIETYKLECDHRYDPDAIRAALTAALPHMGGVTGISLLHGIRDSLRATINEYRDADVFPGARVIMQEQLNALTDALSSHEPTPETKRGIEAMDAEQANERD